MNHFSNLLLLFHTVRHLTLKQVVYRAKAIVRRRWWLIRKQKVPKVLSFKVRDFNCLYKGAREPFSPDNLEGVTEASVERAIGISQGRFAFLNRVVQYKNGVNWHDPEVSRHWRLIIAGAALQTCSCSF